MTKCLITGSAGFIYSNVVLYLQQHTDYEIIGLDKLTYAGSRLNVPESKRYKLHLGDVCDYHLVEKILEYEKPDIIIHGAAESHVDNSITNSSNFISTNVVGTHSMLEAIRKVHTPKLFINASTDEIYGSKPKGRSVENDPMSPRSPYSSSKASADLLGQSYFTTYGLPIITTRSSNNFGPRQHVEKFIPKVITNIFAGKKIPLYGNGQNIREWIYVKDHFHALMTIIEKGKPGEVYNISTNKGITNNEVLDAIFEIVGDEYRELVEHVTDRPGHDLRYAVDCTKLCRLGWSAKYDFKEALLHTISWYKANSWFLKDKKV